MIRYIVELEPGVWLAPWDGDPGRTLKRKNAQEFGKKGAVVALDNARKHRSFNNAKVVRFDCPIPEPTMGEDDEVSAL